MIQGRMLDNGKPQAGSAACLGPTLVHAIEPLKYLALFFRRDTDSRVGDREERMAFVVGAALQRNRTSGSIVADGVACQIIDELVDQARHAFDDHRLGLMTYRHIRLTGDLFKTLLNRVDGTRELNRLRGPNGHRLALSCTLGLVQVR